MAVNIITAKSQNDVQKKHTIQLYVIFKKNQGFQSLIVTILVY